MSSFIDNYGLIIVIAIISGASCGMLGVVLSGLHMPFLAVATAHAALAGAVFGQLLGWPQTLCTFGGALAGALVLGRLLRRRTADHNAALGVVFSVSLGLAFLGIGIMPGAKTETLNLLWGSLLFATPRQALLILIPALALTGFMLYFRRELKVLLFDRALAALLIPEAAIFTALLAMSAAVITVNLDIIGGLLLYSLIMNPALIAMRLANSYHSTMVLGAISGIVSALLGFAAAYFLDLPVGACIVLVSSLLAAASFIVKRRP